MSEGHSIQLGPPEAAARAAIRDGWYADDMSNRMSGFGKGLKGQAEAADALADCLETQDPNLKVLGIYSDGEPVGMFWIVYEGDRKRTAQIHVEIAPKARNWWVFKRAGSALLDLLFSNGVYRVEAEPLRINRRVVKLLRQQGFKQEGIKRSAFWMDNNDYDTVLLRMLRREWKRKEN